MRKKPNLAPRMERVSALLISEPEQWRGRWRELLPDCQELWLELGCGKGRFTAEIAAQNPHTLLLAIERVPDALVMAMERTVARKLNNVYFLNADVAVLPDVLATGEVSRIYLNFPDPWPKSRCAKHRLTAPRFLRRYADVLPIGGELWFKTDNLPLFNWSVEQLEAEAWMIRGLTNDLHAAGPVGVMTDYEAKFFAQGRKINRLVAMRTARTKDSAAGVPERLRNASLSDAKGRAASLAAQRENGISPS